MANKDASALANLTANTAGPEPSFGGKVAEPQPKPTRPRSRKQPAKSRSKVKPAVEKKDDVMDRKHITAPQPSLMLFEQIAAAEKFNGRKAPHLWGLAIDLLAKELGYKPARK